MKAARTSRSRSGARIAVDIGGTFTDVAAFDDETGSLAFGKVLTTPAHLVEGGTNAFTNSAFLVFLRLPDGRAATLDYLKKLRDFGGPLLVKADPPLVHRLMSMSGGISPASELPPGSVPTLAPASTVTW